MIIKYTRIIRVRGGLAMDKKISELTVAQSIDPADVSILVHNNNDYQFSFETLLTYISGNLSTGAVISFGSVLPQNNIGKNGDIFVNTTTGGFAQKLSGIWAIVYTLPTGQLADSTVLYGLGLPNNITGKNNDTYVDTGTGIFYKKILGNWNVVFSMLNGPPGLKGDKGTTGNTGANGKTLLNGTINPSNLNTGTDGDFYININTWNIFGPKTSGIWGTGVSLVQGIDNIKTVLSALTDVVTINWRTDNNGQYFLKHGDYPSYQEINRGDDGKWTINGTANIQEVRDGEGQLTQITLNPSVPGQTNFIII